MADTQNGTVWSINQRPRLRWTITDANGNVFDPVGSVKLRVVDPAGTITNYTYSSTLSKLSTGVYYLDLTVQVAGTWEYRWEATDSVGALLDAKDGSFTVRSLPPNMTKIN